MLQIALFAQTHPQPRMTCRPMREQASKQVA